MLVCMIGCHGDIHNIALLSVKHELLQGARYSMAPGGIVTFSVYQNVHV